MKTKQKSDSRVKRYCPFMVPEGLHHKVKKRAKQKHLRLNQYVPLLLNAGLKTEDDSH
tara:strand:+ start:1965 stop:2138 length:174 start_codon:yes stop_codon:yes gene_type:complete